MDTELHERLLEIGILKKHNLEAYKKVVEMFKTKNKVCISHATGTGKSFISLQLMHDNKNKKIIYLIPQNGIGDQIEEHMKSLSEEEKTRDFSHVKIMTYQSLLNMSKEELKKLDIDMLITDEYHHLGENTKWRECVRIIELTHPNLKTFGTTATPIRNQGTINEENVAKTFFEGNMASIYSLEQAIADRVLPNPIIKEAIYKFEDELNEIELSIEKKECSEEQKEEFRKKLKSARAKVANAASFKDIIRNNVKIGEKYIFFCPRTRLQEYVEQSKEWFDGIIDENDINIYTADSKDPKALENIKEFYNDNDSSKMKIIFVMDMFNEGIHVPDVDKIFMFRETASTIIFYQQLGRALACKGDNKSPVVLDFCNNYSRIIELRDKVHNLFESKKRKKKELNARIFDIEPDLDDEIKFDISIENKEIIAEIKKLKELVALTYSQKLEEYIIMLNSKKFTPTSRDINHYFSDGSLVNYFWVSNYEKIKQELENNPKYKKGFKEAKRKIIQKEKKLSYYERLEEYIELLNQLDFNILTNDKSKFSDENTIGYFWTDNVDKIILELETNEKYKQGYDIAKQKVKSKLDALKEKQTRLNFQLKLEEYINMLNDTEFEIRCKDEQHYFSDGSLVNYFWNDNRDRIIFEIENNPHFQENYEIARQKVKSFVDNFKNKIKELPFEIKLREYIELLNQDTFVPMSLDEKNTFSNGMYIRRFWWMNFEKIKYELDNNDKYQNGYDIAKKKVQNKFEELIKKEKLLTFKEKMAEYIDLLNEPDFVPKTVEKILRFSDGTRINTFWNKNRTKIISVLENDIKYEKGYEVAKQKIDKKTKALKFEEKLSQFIVLLNNPDYIPRNHDEVNVFSDGSLIKYFWKRNFESIKNELDNNIKYQKGYEVAKKKVYDKANELSLSERIKEYIELLNNTALNPKSRESDGVFSDGSLIKYFWVSNSTKVKAELENNVRYKEGYDVAKKKVFEWFLETEKKESISSQLEVYKGLQESLNYLINDNGNYNEENDEQIDFTKK